MYVSALSIMVEITYGLTSVWLVPTTRCCCKSPPLFEIWHFYKRAGVY